MKGKLLFMYIGIMLFISIPANVQAQSKNVAKMLSKHKVAIGCVLPAKKDSVMIEVVCDTCSGLRYHLINGVDSQVCSICSGTGKTQRLGKSPNNKNLRAIKLACAKCNGTGYNNNITCSSCMGKGSIERIIRY